MTWDSYTEYQQGDVLLGPKARVYIALVIFFNLGNELETSLWWRVQPTASPVQVRSLSIGCLSVYVHMYTHLCLCTLYAIYILLMVLLSFLVGHDRLHASLFSLSGEMSWSRLPSQ